MKRHHLVLVTLLLANSAAVRCVVVWLCGLGQRSCADTVLVCCVLQNEALPIFLNTIVPEYVAVILSVSAVLIFGEILPSAVFTGPKQLSIGKSHSCHAVQLCIIFTNSSCLSAAASLHWLVKGLMVLFFVLAFPIAKLLD